MRYLYTRFGAVLAALLGIGTVAGEEPARAAEEKIRVLLVTGGHGFDVASFEGLFRSIPDIDFDHQRHPRALQMLTSDSGAAPDVVVLYDLYQPISAEQRAAYEGRIRRGTGLVVLHHALANFQEWPEYENIVGGKFFLKKRVQEGVEKPPSGAHHGKKISVTIADGNHSITRGLADFVIHDETYNRMRIDPAVHVLLRTDHADSDPVIGWTKPHGRARVVCLQLGHGKEAYANPSYRTLVSRSIRWAARRAPEDAGMKPLFDGRSLDGWRVEGGARFAVEDGILVGRQGRQGEAGDLFSEEEYGDFELEASWAMDWPGNSGVWFRHAGPRQAYQADILEWDNPRCWSGTLYCSGKMFLALNRDASIVRRHGWNTFRILARGDHLQVFLNGRRIADVRDGSSSRGRLGLQVHAGEKFENMAIRLADLRMRRLRGH